MRMRVIKTNGNVIDCEQIDQTGERKKLEAVEEKKKAVKKEAEVSSERILKTG